MSIDYAVVGCGSMGQRHIANLKILYPQARIASISSSGRRLETHNDEVITYNNLEKVPCSDLKFAIIASPAPLHLAHAAFFLHRQIPVLIEKPLSNNIQSFSAFAPLFLKHKDKIDLAYNLRYLSKINDVKNLLSNANLGKVYSVRINVGQYLPSWRPLTDYRLQVSAQRQLGGGALLELSHELDYALWLFGPVTHVFCKIKYSGVLEIDVEDLVDALLTTKSGININLHMNFLQQKAERSCEIIADLGTVHWDLLNNEVNINWVNGHEDVNRDPNYNKNTMYLEELRRFAKVAKGQLPPLVDLEQGLAVLQLISCMQKSAQEKQEIQVGEAEYV